MSRDSVSISYEAAGTGEPALVFVHGWSCDRSYWKNQLEPFAREQQVVVLDLAGHGESGDSRDEWSIAAYGADVAAVVQELDLQSVILVGHSMGGDVIVDAARLLPGRVLGLVWVDTYGQLGSVRTQTEVDAVLEPFRSDFAGNTNAFVRSLFPPSSDPNLVEWVARDMSAAPPSIALASLESSITNDRVVPRLLEQLRLPVISLNPERAEPDVAALERHHVEVVLVPGVGHFMMLEDPDRFNALLRTAVETIGRRSTTP